MVALISALIPAVLACIVAAFALFRWVARVDANTQATEKLTAALERWMPKVTDTLNDHEVRIQVLEKAKR